MAPLDLSNPALVLSFLPTSLHILQLAPLQEIPAKLLEALAGQGDSQSFISVTRCGDETSVILPSELFAKLYPTSASEHPVESLGPWTALKIRGPMDLSLTGILHELTGPLKTAQVPIFASSTWNTDYVLIECRHEATAKSALERAGWTFAQ